MSRPGPAGAERDSTGPGGRPGSRIEGNGQLRPARHRHRTAATRPARAPAPLASRASSLEHLSRRAATARSRAARAESDRDAGRATCRWDLAGTRLEPERAGPRSSRAPPRPQLDRGESRAAASAAPASRPAAADVDARALFPPRDQPQPAVERAWRQGGGQEACQVAQLAAHSPGTPGSACQPSLASRTRRRGAARVRARPGQRPRRALLAGDSGRNDTRATPLSILSQQTMAGRSEEGRQRKETRRERAARERYGRRSRRSAGGLKDSLKGRGQAGSYGTEISLRRRGVATWPKWKGTWRAGLAAAASSLSSLCSDNRERSSSTRSANTARSVHFGADREAMRLRHGGTAPLGATQGVAPASQDLLEVVQHQSRNSCAASAPAWQELGRVERLRDSTPRSGQGRRGSRSTVHGSALLPHAHIRSARGGSSTLDHGPAVEPGGGATSSRRWPVGKRGRGQRANIEKVVEGSGKQTRSAGGLRPRPLVFEAVPDHRVRRTTRGDRHGRAREVRDAAMHIASRTSSAADDETAALRSGVELFAGFVEVIPPKHPADDGGFSAHPERRQEHAIPRSLQIEVGAARVIINQRRFKACCSGRQQAPARQVDESSTSVTPPRRRRGGAATAAPPNHGPLRRLPPCVCRLEGARALVFRMLPPPG